MKILTIILSIFLSSAALADKKNKFNQEEFNAWLDEQYSLIEDPLHLICTQVSFRLYLDCASKLRHGHHHHHKYKKYKYYANVSEICTPLYEASYSSCFNGLTALGESGGSDDNNSGGDGSGDGNSGGGDSGSGSGSGSGDGSQNPDGSTTPPDTDPTDDETNEEPTDPNQPPIL